MLVLELRPAHMRIYIVQLVNSPLPLHASMPSIHVWSSLESPASPQFLNQEPEGAQQLRLPDFFKVPHLAHVIALAIVEVVAGAVAVHVTIDMVVLCYETANGT